MVYLTPLEKISKARIQIQAENPFFAYLSLYLKFREAKEGELTGGGMGVNARGDCVFNKEFVEGLDDEELKGVIVHEIMHLAFLHLLRLGHRIPLLWNIATDIIVNNLVTENNFKLPKGCLLSDYTHEITIFGQKIKDTNKKTPEMIYDEFKFKFKKGDGPIGPGGFDEHFYDDGKADEEKDLEKQWKERLTDAYVTAKQAGKLPAGIERMMDKIHKNEINWRTVLLREVQKAIPSDYTYIKPHKISFSTGVYFPNVSKEMIDIVVGVDVSGSVDKQTYADFVSEVVGMSKAFRNKINIRFITHDYKVQNDYKVENGNVEKIIKLRINGGGGTSHKDILEHIKEKVKHARLAIFLTDGYSDLDRIDLDDYNFKKLFVLQKNGTDKQIDKTKCKILQLKGDY